MRKINVIVLLIACTINLFAQTDKENRRERNDIKKNPDYLYAETLHEIQDTAYSKAKDLLWLKVQEFVANDVKLRDADGVIIENIQKKSKSVSFMQGIKTHAVFVYVNKQDIFPMYKPTPQEPTPQLGEVTQNAELTPIKKTEEEIQKEKKDSLEEKEQMLIKQIIALDDWEKIAKHLLTRQETYNDITAGTVEDTPEDVLRARFWIVLDEASGKVKALFDKTGKYDMKNHCTDTIARYPDSSKVWFQIYE